MKEILLLCTPSPPSSFFVILAISFLFCSLQNLYVTAEMKINATVGKDAKLTRKKYVISARNAWKENAFVKEIQSEMGTCAEVSISVAVKPGTRCVQLAVTI